jgi:Type IV secretion system pilin
MLAAPARREIALKCLTRRLGLAVIVGAAGLAVALLPLPALAQTANPTQTLSAVINRIQTLIIGLAAGLATLFLTWAGMRYMMAGGDPGQMEKAKTALRSAAIGYGVAALAPALFALLKFVVVG